MEKSVIEMLSKLLKKPKETLSIYHLIQEEIRSCSPTCGLIIVECALKKRQLKRLEKRMAKEAAEHKASYLYNERLLTISFEGLDLSHVQWLGMFAKSFLLANFGLKGKFLVAEFLKNDYPSALEVEGIVNQMLEKAEFGGNLYIYNDNFNSEKDQTVLIIDDDPVAGELLKIRLETQGYEVHQAYDGIQGIRACEELRPDVVIMELILPALDGYQVIRNIQESEDMDSHIIVLSDQRLEKNVDACYELGVADYMMKPYSPVELEARIRTMLE